MNESPSSHGLIDEYRHELTRIALFADQTVAIYISCLLAGSEFMRATFGGSLLTCDNRHLRQWFAELKREQKSSSTLSRHLYALRGFYTFLLKRQAIAQNPMAGFGPIKAWRSDKNQPIPPDFTRRLIQSVERTTWLGLRNCLMISLLWALGLRLQETTTLKVGSVELSYESTRRIALLRVKGKGRKERALFVVDRLYDLMIEYLRHPDTPKLQRAPLFPTRSGNAVSGGQLRDIVKAAACRAGIEERVTPHVLRHSFATDMYHRGTPLNALRAMMGHAEIAETAVYIHVAEQLQAFALEQLAFESSRRP